MHDASFRRSAIASLAFTIFVGRSNCALQRVEMLSSPDDGNPLSDLCGFTSGGRPPGPQANYFHTCTAHVTGDTQIMTTLGMTSVFFDSTVSLGLVLSL